MSHFKILRKSRELEEPEFGLRRVRWSPPLPTPMRCTIHIIWLGYVGISWLTQVRDMRAEGLF